MFDNLFSSTTLLEAGLDAAWLRNEVITNNIANVDTTDFKRSDVEFEEIFKEALEDAEFNATSSSSSYDYSALEDIEAVVVEDSDTSMRLDGNNVDIDYESAELAKNTIYYNVLIQKISSEFDKIRMAIREGE